MRIIAGIPQSGVGSNGYTNYHAPGEDHSASSQAQTSYASAGKTCRAARRQAASKACGGKDTGATGWQAGTNSSRIPGKRGKGPCDSGCDISRERGQGTDANFSGQPCDSSLECGFFDRQSRKCSDCSRGNSVDDRDSVARNGARFDAAWGSQFGGFLGTARR